VTSITEVGAGPEGRPRAMRWYDYVTVNLFWLGLNIRNTAVGGVFMPYLVAAFVAPDVKNTALSTMRTVGLIVAMLVQPAVGLLSDRNTSRFGRRRPLSLSASCLTWFSWRPLPCPGTICHCSSP